MKQSLEIDALCKDVLEKINEPYHTVKVGKNTVKDGSYNQVFGYQNMYVIDGSMISANPGVNPALSITAIAERAMSKIKPKSQQSSAI